MERLLNVATPLTAFLAVPPTRVPPPGLVPIVSVIAVQDLLYSVQLVYHRTYEVIPLLMVATVWYTVVTSVLGVGQYYVERYYARGSESVR